MKRLSYGEAEARDTLEREKGGPGEREAEKVEAETMEKGDVGKKDEGETSETGATNKEDAVVKGKGSTNKGKERKKGISLDKGEASKARKRQTYVTQPPVKTFCTRQNMGPLPNWSTGARDTTGTLGTRDTTGTLGTRDTTGTLGRLK